MLQQQKMNLFLRLICDTPICP